MSKPYIPGLSLYNEETSSSPSRNPFSSTGEKPGTPPPETEDTTSHKIKRLPEDSPTFKTSPRESKTSPQNSPTFSPSPGNSPTFKSSVVQQLPTFAHPSTSISPSLSSRVLTDAIVLSLGAPTDSTSLDFLLGAPTDSTSQDFSSRAPTDSSSQNFSSRAPVESPIFPPSDDEEENEGNSGEDHPDAHVEDEIEIKLRAELLKHGHPENATHPDPPLDSDVEADAVEDVGGFIQGEPRYPNTHPDLIEGHVYSSEEESEDLVMQYPHLEIVRHIDVDLSLEVAGPLGVRHLGSDGEGVAGLLSEDLEDKEEFQEQASPSMVGNGESLDAGAEGNEEESEHKAKKAKTESNKGDNGGSKAKVQCAFIKAPKWPKAGERCRNTFNGNGETYCWIKSHQGS